MSDFLDDTTQKIEWDKFFKNKASLLENLADNGDMKSLNEELVLFNNLNRDKKITFFRNYLEFNFNELRTICDMNYRLNRVNVLNIGSLPDLVDAYHELEVVGLEISSFKESKRQKIAERRNNITLDLRDVSQRVVKDTLIDLYYLAENNELERFYDLKNEYEFLIGGIYTPNYFFDTLFSKVDEIEKSFGLNSSYESLFRNVFDVVNKAYDCFSNHFYSDGFNYLNHAEEFIESNKLEGYHPRFDNFKSKLVNHYISVHLSEGFFCAEKRDEQGMNDELSAAKLLMKYIGHDNHKDVEIIENVCYKESISWIVDEFEKEALKPKPDEKHIKQLSSNFKKYVNNLKFKSNDDFLFAEKHERKLSNIGKKIDDNFKNYIF